MANVPLLLEEEFASRFLGAEADARQHRAILAHLLTAADMRAAFGNKIAEALSSVTAAKVAEEELTSEAASKLLHASRTHVNSLADSGAFGPIRRTEGGHRRISKAALLAYKAEGLARQSSGLDEMMAATRRLGLYDEELAAISRRSKRKA